ncbi:ankyrin repeat domain-containing protein [Bordetella tumulicola]|uniref:ankyrin repeat domain-containing protein n=1 Tax=Bordetella tumulicola TaxID=1649133 RepID=UPI0039EFA93E
MTSFNPVRAAYNYVVGNNDQQNQELEEDINKAIKYLFDEEYVSSIDEMFEEHPDEVIAALKRRETPPLCEAVEKNLESAVSTLLKIIPFEIDTPNSDGLTPSMLAAKQGSEYLVRELLSGNADMQKVDATGCTALMWAVLSGIVELVRSLLGAGAIPSVDVQDKGGNTALMFAVMNMKDHTRGSEGLESSISLIYELLNNAKANVTLTNKDGDTALGLMASQPAFNRSIAHRLYNEGTDLSAQNHEGLTPIALASRSGNTEAVRFLIEYMKEENIDIDMKDKQGRTALFHAISSNNRETVKELRDAGARPYSMDIALVGQLLDLDSLDGEMLKLAGLNIEQKEKPVNVPQASSIDVQKT